MERLQREIATLESMMSAPEFYQRSKEDVAAANMKLVEYRSRLNSAEAEWLKATEELERVG
jgi:hypothetical protein